MRTVLALGLALTLGCSPKLTPPAAITTAEAPAPPEPVFFAYGNAELAGPADKEQIAHAARILAKDPKQYLFLAGYADPSGTVGANLVLSKARADVVREQVLQASGVKADRVIARGLGELDRSGRVNTSLRRVDFIFVERGLLPPKDSDRIVGMLVEQGVIDPGAQASTTPAPAARTPGAPPSAGEADDIVTTGLADIDAVFAQVQTLLDLVRGAKSDIAKAESGLQSALGVAPGTSLEDSLAKLKTDAKGSIKVEMSGGKPRLGLKPGASPEVTKAVGGVNELIASLGRATKRLAEVPKQAQAIIGQAKTIPSTLPATLKSAGMGAKELPGMLKAVKKNLRLTASVPKECAAVGKQAASTFKTVGSSFR